MPGESKIIIKDDTHGTLEACHGDFDYFFLIFFCEHLLNDINNYIILSGLRSDILKLDLNMDKRNRGRRFWKFNKD